MFDCFKDPDPKIAMKLCSRMFNFGDLFMWKKLETGGVYDRKKKFENITILWQYRYRL